MWEIPAAILCRNDFAESNLAQGRVELRALL